MQLIDLPYCPKNSLLKKLDTPSLISWFSLSSRLIPKILRLEAKDKMVALLISYADKQSNFTYKYWWWHRILHHTWYALAWCCIVVCFNIHSCILHHVAITPQLPGPVTWDSHFTLDNATIGLRSIIVDLPTQPLSPNTCPHEDVERLETSSWY